MEAAAQRATAAVTSQPKEISRGSMVIAAFSTIVEWYDFTLYLYFATVLSRVFFGGGDAALMTTLAGFAVAYLMRPFGAVLFGHIGDRFGRRKMLLLSVALMTFMMLSIGLLPTYAQVGPASAWLLLLFRCVMAFSVGGEYSGVTAYLMEGARPSRRGLVTSLASAASEIGALLAVGVSALTVALLDQASLDSWGWRIPFLVGAVLAGSVWLARSTMEESPEFEQQKRSGSVPSHPLCHVLAHHRGALYRAFAISALASVTYYVGIIYVPTYLTSAGTLNEGDALWLSTIAAVAVIAVTPLVGALTDHFGRKPVLIVLAVSSIVLPLAMFPIMAGSSQPQVLAAAIVLACLAGGISAAGPVAIAEQFPGEGRLSGLAIGATIATTIFGGLAPLVAQIVVARSASPIGPGAIIAVVAVFVLPMLLFFSETAPGKTQKPTLS
jgi:MHS family proline/betaine transporter-like MFS transporter